MSGKYIKKCMKCEFEWKDFAGALAQIKPIKKTNWLGDAWYEVGCPKCKSCYFHLVKLA